MRHFFFGEDDSGKKQSRFLNYLFVVMIVTLIGLPPPSVNTPEIVNLQVVCFLFLS